jgi:two-component system chemotaxis response regulator CheY
MPILMVTTAADPEERERAMAAGVDGYLVKPVTADVVTQHIRHILKNLFTRGGTSNA